MTDTHIKTRVGIYMYIHVCIIIHGHMKLASFIVVFAQHVYVSQEDKTGAALESCSGRERQERRGEVCGQLISHGSSLTSGSISSEGFLCQAHRIIAVVVAVQLESGVCCSVYRV